MHYQNTNDTRAYSVLIGLDFTYGYSVPGCDSVNAVSVARFPEESLVTILRVRGGNRLLRNICNHPRSCTMSQPRIPNVNSHCRENLNSIWPSTCSCTSKFFWSLLRLALLLWDFLRWRRRDIMKPDNEIHHKHVVCMRLRSCQVWRRACVVDKVNMCNV